MINWIERDKPFSFLYGDVLILLNRSDMTSMNYGTITTEPTKEMDE